MRHRPRQPSVSCQLTWSAAAVALALLLPAPAEAQVFGNVYGMVRDQNGQALPGVAVSLEGMGAPKITITDDRGAFRFLALDPGYYGLTAQLDSYSTVEQPDVIVALNRNTTIDFTLTSALEESIVVTSESPLLDERKLSAGTVISQLELEKIPTARDPWSILTQAPGVLTDRINVGGNESDQQSNFIGLGSTYRDNDYLMDGIQITDAAGLGGATSYPDFEQFESVELSTGGPDVTRNTSGVAINMVTKRGTNAFRGTARFISAKSDGLGFLGQSSSSFDCNQAGPDQPCDSITPSAINHINEYGFEAGGPAIADRLWFWGSWGVRDISKFKVGGSQQDTILENATVKVNGQLGSSNSALASWNNANKKQYGRGAGPQRGDETLIDQRGPTAYWRFEDSHVFSSSLFLTGSYQKSDQGFQFRSRGLDTGLETLWDSDGVWRQNWISGSVRSPEEAIKLDGSYFFDTHQVTHELKFGGRMRAYETVSPFAWPGRGIVNIAGENFGNPAGPVDFFIATRVTGNGPVEMDYTSLWVQDTIAGGRWTANVGFRYDIQDGVNQPGTTGVSPLPELFPEVVLDKPLDTPFDWETITPRIGLTYAAGENRDTLLRASFSQFPQVIGWGEVSWQSPLRAGYAYFLFFDSNDDNQFQDGEFFVPLFTDGFDPDNPTANLNTVDPDLKPEMTGEAIVGIEHAFLPELVVGLNYTYRQVEDIQETKWLLRPVGSNGAGFMETPEHYVLEGMTGGVLPNGEEVEVPIYGLDPANSESGWFHRMTGTRTRDYHGVSLTINKRLANNWALRGYFNWGETHWNVPADFQARDDPNDQPNGADNDGALFYMGSGGSRGANIILQSSWTANMTGLYQVAVDRPWGFTLSGNVYARQGSPIPYHINGMTSDGFGRSISLLGKDLDRFRNPTVLTADLRVEKEFSATEDVSLTFGLDLFNALNESPVLARSPNLTSGTGDWVQDVLSPRVWRIGVRIAWR